MRETSKAGRRDGGRQGRSPLAAIVTLCAVGAGFTGAARADEAPAEPPPPLAAGANAWGAPPAVPLAPSAVAPASPPVGGPAVVASPAPPAPVNPWMAPSFPAQPVVQAGPKLVEVTEYYRGQVVLADLVGILAVGLIGSHTNSGWSVLPYFLASPSVHIAHGNTGRAFGSLGLHVALPLIGVVMAVATSEQCHNSDACGDSGGEFAAWILGGFVAATVVDAVFLANVTKVVEQPRQQARLTPLVLPTRSGGATFGLAALF